MDIKEMRELPLAELRSEAGKLEATIWKMRFQAKGEPLENSGNYREIKKDRARLLTILREKELVGDDTAPAASEDPSEEATAEDAEENASVEDAGEEESTESTEEPGES